jgi:pentatricopeptide repeat protein
MKLAFACGVGDQAAEAAGVGQASFGNTLWNALLAIYAGCGQLQRALSTLELMSLAGVPPDAVCFPPLLHAAQEQRQWRGALKLYEAMVAAQLPVDRDAFEAVATTCAAADQASHASSTLRTMVRQGLAPSTEAWNHCLVAHNRAGRPLLALALFDDMCAEKCPGDAVTYSAVVAAAAAARQVRVCVRSCRLRHELRGQQLPHPEYALEGEPLATRHGFQRNGRHHFLLAHANASSTCWSSTPLSQRSVSLA